MREVDNGENDRIIEDFTKTLEREFVNAMNTDFNTPLSLSIFTSTLNKLRAFAENNVSIGKHTKKSMIDLILEFGGIFGILKNDCYKKPISEAAVKLLNERINLRKTKHFSKSDLVREKLKEEYHIIVDDTENGQKWHYDIDALL